jgi:hypothetical protein
MSKKMSYARKGIMRLIEASSNPNLMARQAEFLMNEAKDNCDIAFGEHSNREFSELIRMHISDIFDEMSLKADQELEV